MTVPAASEILERSPFDSQIWWVMVLFGRAVFEGPER